MKLVTRNLALARGGRTLFEGLDLEIEPGRLLVLLGPNGSGKSSLLACLRGALAPDEGKVFLDDRPMASLSLRERARRIAWVPQKIEISDLCVWHAVLLGRCPHMGWVLRDEDRQKTAEALRRFGLEGLAHRRCESLSGGEAQRVALARALAQDARGLLLDEPTSDLDLRGQVETLDLVRGLIREQGVFALVVLHDLNLALSQADDLLLLGKGTAQRIRPQELDGERLEELYSFPMTLHSVEGRSVVLPGTRSLQP